MKILIMLVSVISLSAYSLNLVPGKYRGGGTWKAEDKTVGRWTEIMDLSKTKEGYTGKVKLEVSQNGKVVFTEDQVWGLKTINRDFFEVVADNKTVGNGYCYGNMCHLDYTTEKERSEETFSFSRGTLRKMGSHQGEMEGKPLHVAFEGVLRRVK